MEIHLEKEELKGVLDVDGLENISRIIRPCWEDRDK